MLYIEITPMNIPSLYIKIKSNQHVQWFKGRLIIFVPLQEKKGKDRSKDTCTS